MKNKKNRPHKEKDASKYDLEYVSSVIDMLSQRRNIHTKSLETIFDFNLNNTAKISSLVQTAINNKVKGVDAWIDILKMLIAFTGSLFIATLSLSNYSPVIKINVLFWIFLVSPQVILLFLLLIFRKSLLMSVNEIIMSQVKYTQSMMENSNQIMSKMLMTSLEEDKVKMRILKELEKN